MGVLKKTQNTPRPSEHPPVMGSKVSFMFRCRRNPGKLYKIVTASSVYCKRQFSTPGYRLLPNHHSREQYEWYLGNPRIIIETGKAQHLTF